MALVREPSWSGVLKCTLTSSGWRDWTLHCNEVHAWERGYKWKRESGLSFKLHLGATPPAIISLTAPGYDGRAESSDVLVYWMQNFFFQGVLETSSSRLSRKLDGFEFALGETRLRFRQTADHKELENAIRSGEITGGVASVVEVRGALVTDSARAETDLSCLFSLISALEGTWVSPVAEARYDGAGHLKEIRFFAEHGRACQRRRPYVNNVHIPGGWASVLHVLLPGFIKHAESLELRSVCRQLIESERDLYADSAIAILLMCLEQLSTRYLESRGVRTRKMPLDHKLNRLNQDLGCLSKGFRKVFTDGMDDFRNALFHTGASTESDLGKLYDTELEFRNACILMLCAVCGYRGPLRLHRGVTSEVKTVEDVGR